MITGKIVTACFCGSSIGALLALQFQMFWGFGVLIGGAIGYVAYAFEEIPAAMKKVWADIPERRQLLDNIKECFRDIGISVAATFVFFVLLATAFVAIMSLIDVVRMFDGRQHGTPGLFPMIGNIVMLLDVVIIEILEFDGFEGKKQQRIIQCTVLACSPTIAFITFTAVGVIVVCGATYCIYWLSRTGAKLFWQTFKLVHSNIRLLCMTDSMIGAIVGYFAGNVLVGGIVGAILGVINYHVVSVRWLRLVAPKLD